VAATLAAALVAYKALNVEGVPLIDTPMVNTIIVLVLITAILGPVLTRRAALWMQPNPERPHESSGP